MYFLRRRHGRKPQTPRDTQPRAPVESPAAGYPADQALPDPAEFEPAEPARPVVVTKTKRQRAVTPEQDDVKPAGTFRSGTLHIAHGRPSGGSDARR
jgi:hypothetical protein